MRHTVTFPRDGGTQLWPTWLYVLKGANAYAKAVGQPEPFGGTPKISTGMETYKSGATVSFTETSVVLSWGDDEE